MINIEQTQWTYSVGNNELTTLNHRLKTKFDCIVNKTKPNWYDVLLAHMLWDLKFENTWWEFIMHTIFTCASFSVCHFFGRVTL